MQQENHTKDIGTLTGTTLVFGGVYSNYQALQAIQQVATDYNIPKSNIICTGDVVAYCAQPEECVQAMKDWGIHTVAGNVEIQLAEGLEDCGCNFESGTTCNILSNQWYPYAQHNLSPESINWMKGLPDFLSFNIAGKKAFALHGSYDETAEYIFKSTPTEKKQAILNQVNADVVLAGHCGLPFHDVIDQKHWINAGVIGMPANDGTTEVWYTILQPSIDDIEVSFHRLAYDHIQASSLMKKEGLPSQYSQTLSTGIWDNCDILPEVETRIQGQRINLDKS